ncbi:MAG: PAS domain-containing sensor histidine kinase [Chloroflexi bacterium]|nr:PAS domain-containing sensor histidine kinase [Chloroflexota bacterium]
MSTEIQAARATPTTAEQLVRLLQAIADDLPLQLAVVYSYYHHLNRLESIAEYAAAPATTGAQNRLRRLLEDRAVPGSEPLLWLHSRDLAGTGMSSGVVFRLLLGEELIGLLAVFSTAPTDYTSDAIQSILPWVGMVRTIVENKHLRDNQAAARALQSAARIIGDSPSPQALVNIVREQLCNPHVGMCVLLFYGPVQENRPNGPFEYLEVQGSWLRRYGDGVGLGVRLYLDQYADLVQELDTRKVITVPTLKPYKNRLDPLVRAILRAERLQSLTLIALHAPQRRLGVIAIATDTPYQFTPLELDNFQTFSDFLAVGTMAGVLQRQHDQVQQARSAMLDAVADGVMLVLPHPHQPSVLTVNDYFTRMFQISRASAEGQPLTALLNQMQLPDDTRQELRRRWFNVPLSDPVVQKGEFALMHPDGFPAAIVWYSAPVHHEGRVMGRLFTFHDVSAERTSATLRANFISWVSHELRTPLTSIKGFAEFILEASGDQLPDLAREYTEIIRHSATHLNRVFTDIIEIARADTGQLKLNISDSHLPDIIINTVALLELQYKERGQTVIMDLDDDLPPVRVDPNRMAQVLSNLLVNSIKYAPPESQIHISTRYVRTCKHLPASAPPDVVLPGVLVTVVDEGPGIAPDETEQIFLPFFRTKEARASKIAGTGLGLTIARSIVELHRGKIWAEGRRRGRRGGTFLLTVPVAHGT